MPRADILPASLPPRGISREEAARWVGVSPVTFDRMVADGFMPQPRRIYGRKVWDLQKLNLAFDALPEEGATDHNEWNGAT